MKPRAIEDYPDRDVTPEHTKRRNDHNSEAPIHPDVSAAYDYVEAVMDTFDIDHFGSPAWHGWAIREAFLAGASHAAAEIERLTVAVAVRERALAELCEANERVVRAMQGLSSEIDRMKVKT